MMGDAANGYELGIERRIAAPPHVVWKVWHERLEEWWAPKPWTTKKIAHDLRPGGRSLLEMKGPDGNGEAMEGVFLEVVPERRIVVTNAFRADWIPQAPFMVAIFTFEPDGDGTLYRACARHWSEEAMKQHEAMGFIEGWAIVAGQLAALAEK
jgi:uncharacterized protein YndB with AHSA1/START domain